MRTPHTVFQNRRATIPRTFIVSLSLLALVSIGLGPGGAAAGSMNTSSASVVQTTVPMLTGVFQVVNDGPGEQFDPRANFDRTAYVNDDSQGAQTIHYFDFATQTNLECQ